MSFIKKSSVYFISNIIASGVTIGSLPILTRHLSPSDYGVFVLFITFGQVCTGFLSLGLSTASYKYFFDYKEKIEDYKILNTTNIVMNFIIFIFFGFIVYFLSPWISSYFFDGEINIDLINLSYLCGCITYYNYYFFQLYIAQGKANYFSVFTILQSIIKLTLVLFFIYLFSFKYMALIYGFLISNLLILLGLVIFSKNLITNKFSIDYFIQSVKLSYPQIPTMIIGLLYSSFDRVMLNKMGGLHSVGQYSFGARFGSLIKVVNDSFANVFGPFFQSRNSENDINDANDIIDRFLFIAYSITLISISLILFAEEIVRLFTTPAYYPSMFVIPIYIFYHLFGILGILATNQLLKAEKLISEIPTAVISLSINILLNLVLIPIYGIIGAAIATAVSALINNLTLLYFGFKANPIRNFKPLKLINIYFIAIIFTGISYSLMAIDILWFNKILIKLSIISSIIFVFYKLDYLNRSKINHLFQLIRKY